MQASEVEIEQREQLGPDGENGGAAGNGRGGAQAQAPATNDKPALHHAHKRLEQNKGISTHQLARYTHIATMHLQGCACRWVPSWALRQHRQHNWSCVAEKEPSQEEMLWR